MCGCAAILKVALDWNLAPFAARLPRVTGLTLSKEQLAEATLRVDKAGLGDKVTLLLCDYRCGARLQGARGLSCVCVAAPRCSIAPLVCLHPAGLGAWP